MFVFLVELQNLQNFRAGLLELFAGFRIAGGGGGHGAECAERFVKADEEGAFAIEQRGVGRALVLAQVVVLREHGGVNFFTEGLMGGEGGDLAHGWEVVWATAPVLAAAGALFSAGGASGLGVVDSAGLARDSTSVEAVGTEAAGVV